MRRLSIRARLTLVVAATLAVVLAAVGGFVYARVSAELEGPIRTELDEHSAGLARMLARGEPLEGRGPPGTQILAADGRVLNVAPDTPRLPLLGAADLRRTLRARRLTSLTIAGRRVDAVAQTYRGRPVVAVASISLAQREHALERLATELILGSLAGLLAGTLVAYLIARRAFEPFETMRRQAAAITASEPGGRLAVPRSDDELARLADTLNDMLDRLERALAHERRFVAEASHELRTPLAVLRAELELARARPRSREELAEALDSVAEETDRLTRLADDLLVLARADDEAVRERRTTIDVAELLETVASHLRARADAEDRTLEVAAPEGLEVAGDRSALHRALSNLVDNALRHGEGAIRLTAREAGGRVELHVADEGEGFPADFLPVAFERFSRAAGDRSPEGAGLGLALVRAVAVAHDGTAEAGTPPQGGADVWLSLPQSEARAAPERIDPRARISGSA